MPRDCWPTEEQRLLLRASLLGGPAALAAWHEWRRRVDVDRLDAGSTRLLPLLGHNLATLGVEDPLVERWRGARRAVWTANTLRLAQTAEVLRVLHAAGVATMLLKGAALVSLHYGDRGLRPMADADVLVPTRQARTAMDILAAHAWTPVGLAQGAARPELTIPVRHSHGFQHPAGHQLDLHWHVFWECCAPDDDEELWEAAVPVDLFGIRTRALGPADQILHVCVHGARWSDVPPFRWAADALTVLRAPGMAVDWSRLVDQARRRRFVLEMRDTLALLAEILEAPVPPAVVAALRAAPVSRIERIAHVARTRRPGLPGAFLILLDHYRRLARSRPAGSPRLGLLRYLLLTYECERVRDLGGVLREKIRAAGLRRRRRATHEPPAGTGRRWLERPPWEPVLAPLQSTVATRSRDTLLAVVAQFEVETAARYRRASRGEHSDTWCNIFTWDVTRALGAEVPHCVDEGGRAVPVRRGRELTANGTVSWLETHGPLHGWAEGDAVEATRAAAAGQPVLAAWQNPDGHGHIAVVVPAGPGEGVQVAQAGAVCFGRGPLARGFGERPVRFFIHP